MPEYAKLEVAKVARKQKAVIWLTLIFAISLGYFSVATIQRAAEVARNVISNKQIQEWVRVGRSKETVANPNSEDAVAKPGYGLLFEIFPMFLLTSRPYLPYKTLAAATIIHLVCVYQLVRALKFSPTSLWSVSMLVPFLNLLVLLWLNHKATYALRSKGVAVGLMGAKKAELEKLALSD